MILNPAWQVSQIPRRPSRYGLLVVTEERSAFFAMYEMRTDRPGLALVRRAPTADHELLAAAFQAAVKKARELGWIA